MYDLYECFLIHIVFLWHYPTCKTSLLAALCSFLWLNFKWVCNRELLTLYLSFTPRLKANRWNNSFQYNTQRHFIGSSNHKWQLNLPFKKIDEEMPENVMSVAAEAYRFEPVASAGNLSGTCKWSAHYILHVQWMQMGWLQYEPSQCSKTVVWNINVCEFWCLWGNGYTVRIQRSSIPGK